MTRQEQPPPLPPLIDLGNPVIAAQRIAAAVRAHLGGYFWLPCPLCGVPFGGQEWLRGDASRPSHIPTGQPHVYQGICPFCTRAGRGWDDPMEWEGSPDAA